MHNTARHPHARRSRPGGISRLTYLFVIVFIGSFQFGRVPVAQGASDIGYRDFSYSGISAPTGQKPQSKLWFNDGIWWGVLFNSSTAKYQIYRFDGAKHNWGDTGVVVDERNRSRPDCLWDGTHLYVASAGTDSANSNHSGRVMRYTYVTSTKHYTLDAGFPVTIARNGMEAIVLAKDAVGTLWVTYTQNSQVYVAHSTANDRSWVASYVLPSSGATSLLPDDLSTIVAYAGHIGIMWSNQNDSTMYFASHADGANDQEWSTSIVMQGPKLSDDHINLKSLDGDPSGLVFAAVKSSLNDGSSPNSDASLILLLVLKPDNTWQQFTFGQVRDNHTRPIVLIDQESRQLYMFAASPCCSGGVIYYKQTSLDKIVFDSGLGTPFIQMRTDTHINNVTSTKQNLNSMTGLLVVASDDTSGYYVHNEIKISPPDTTTPSSAISSPAEGVTVSGRVMVTADASDDSGVAQVQFFLDENLLGTDLIAPYEVEWDTANSPAGKHELYVQVQDLAGNISQSGPVMVTIQAPKKRLMLPLILS
jgi:hypothetical protein